MRLAASRQPEDSGHRVAALRQLVTMTTADVALMRAFVTRGGVELVRGEIERLLDDGGSSSSSSEPLVLTEQMKPALAACVSLVKLVARRDAVVRERLSRDSGFLVLLVRVSALCKLSVCLLYEAAVLVGLMAFHDVLRVYVAPTVAADVAAGGGAQASAVSTAIELSLPRCVSIRYKVLACFLLIDIYTA